MKRHLSILVLLFLLFLVTFLFNQAYLKPNTHEISNELNNNKIELELNYLTKSLDINFKKAELPINSSETREMFIYIPNTSCVSCVDTLLNYLGEQHLDSKFIVYTSNSSQYDYIRGFNDKFQYNFEPFSSMDYVFNKVDYILVYRVSEKAVNELLPFDLSNKKEFKKYFKEYFVSK